MLTQGPWLPRASSFNWTKKHIPRFLAAYAKLEGDTEGQN